MRGTFCRSGAAPWPSLARSVQCAIIIAGGGIGGLTLALMLHQRGIPCQVHEAATGVKPLGVGINLLPHSIRELAALDLLPRLDEIAIRTRTLTYRQPSGTEDLVGTQGYSCGARRAAVLGASRPPAYDAVASGPRAPGCRRGHRGPATGSLQTAHRPRRGHLSKS